MTVRPDLLVIGHSSVVAINRALYRALMRDGLSVELVVPPEAPTGLPLEARRADDPVLHVLAIKGKNLRYLRYQGLMELIEQRRPRAIFLDNEPDTPTAGRLGRWAKRNGAVFVCQSLENALPPFGRTLLSGKIKAALRSLRTRAGVALNRPYLDLVFCHSEPTLEILKRLKMGDRARLVPLGFDETAFRPDAALRQCMRERLGLTLPTVGYFGRLVPEKGVHWLIDSLAPLAGLPWQFLLNRVNAGTPYAQEIDRRLKAAGIESRVVPFKARHEEMPGYMNAVDLAVVPSLWEEQYGRVAAEAMACGCPVIASRSGALPRLVEGSGQLVAKGDVVALSRAIAAWIENPQSRMIAGQAAAASAQQRLSIARQAALTAAALRPLLQAN